MIERIAEYRTCGEKLYHPERCGRFEAMIAERVIFSVSEIL